MLIDERACTTDAGPMYSVTGARQLALAFVPYACSTSPQLLALGALLLMARWRGRSA
jgi:hypothetical protein